MKPTRIGLIAALLSAAISFRPAAAESPARPLPRGSAPQKPKMLLAVNFDTEDYITPASEGIDDIPKWLADIMTEEGVRATFYVIGEKARSLEKRGRQDVIRAMARHDIGSHTNFGSMHPTVTELLERADWAGGVATMLERESAGFREIERIFGVPAATMGRHGGSYGPQLVAALGRLGKGFSGSPAGVAGKTAAWFCNALNFSRQIGGWDDTFYRDDLFEPAFAKLQADLPELARTCEAVSFFVGHPTMIRAEEFWDLNYYAGRNPSPAEWRAPKLRPPASMATARKNSRRMMHWLNGRGDIEIATFGDWMKLYAPQKETMSAAGLRAFAAEALRTGTIPDGGNFSPAEAFAGFTASIAAAAGGASLPRELASLRPLGPPEREAAPPKPVTLSREAAFDLARRAVGEIRRTGALPARLASGGTMIGTGPLFALFAAVYLDLADGKPKAAYGAGPFEAYPRANEKAVVDAILGYKTWPVHKPDLDMSAVVEQTRLQLWTLKPAVRK
jgi:hypothetical protein